MHNPMNLATPISPPSGPATGPGNGVHPKSSFLAIAAVFLAALTTVGRAEINGQAEFAKMKYGFFVHYVWGGSAYEVTRDHDGKTPKSLNDLADRFDAEGFANDLAAWQVEYVIFTAWHANINPLFPSKTMEKWGLTEHICKRDLLRDLINACKAKGIAVMFYTHPRDGHDLRGEDRLKTGWGPGGSTDPDWSKFDKAKWNDFTNDLYGELVDRYGDDIVGLYLDEGSGAGDSHRVVDYPRLRQTIKRQHPHLVMVQNFYGNLYSCDAGDRELGGPPGGEGDTWGAMSMSPAIVFASQWWANTAGGSATVRSTPEAMFRYTVLQAGHNKSGGVQWAAGPYPGGGWETGVDATMRKLGACIQPIAASIKNTYPSRSYPTPAEASIASLSWGVATTSPDGRYEYLHVLKAPADRSRTLKLALPADGRPFGASVLLASGKPAGLSRNAEGLTVTLPDGAEWDKLDTVIRLEVDPQQLQNLRTEATGRLRVSVTAVAKLLAQHPDKQRPEFDVVLAQARAMLQDGSVSLPEMAALSEDLEAIADSLSPPQLPPADRNLALNKSVTASSTHFTTQVQSLTTGRRDATDFWSSAASESTDHHERVIVDLGRETIIDSVFLFPRLQGGGDGDGFPQGLAIRASADGSKWKTVFERDHLAHPHGSPRDFVFAPTAARFVMIEATHLRPMASDGGRYRMQLAAVEVFGPGR